jgi:hypothetical protein
MERDPDRNPAVSQDLYRTRVKRGWPPEKAATTAPIRDKSAHIVVDGVATTVTQARKLSGVGRNLYHTRLRLGWTPVRAASTPPGRVARKDAKTEPFYEYRGKRMSLFLWARHLKKSYRTLLSRMNKGLTFEEAVKHRKRAPILKRKKDGQDL